MHELAFIYLQNAFQTMMYLRILIMVSKLSHLEAYTLNCSFHAWRRTYHARKNLGLFFFIDTALQTGLQAITKTNV